MTPQPTNPPSEAEKLAEIADERISISLAHARLSVDLNHQKSRFELTLTDCAAAISSLKAELTRLQALLRQSQEDLKQWKEIAECRYQEIERLGREANERTASD